MISVDFLLFSFDVLGNVNIFGFQAHQTLRLSVFVAFPPAQTLWQSAFVNLKGHQPCYCQLSLALRPQNHGTVSIFWLPGPTILVLSAFWVPKALVSIFKPPGPQTLGNVSESLQFSLLSLWYLRETQWMHELSFQIRWRLETNRLALVCHCNPLEYLETHWCLSFS